MKLLEVTGYHSKTAQILKEGIQDLTESQIIYLNKWEKELWPLLEEYTRLAEAELTKDQVMSIFQGAEEVAMSGGKNKTMLGKAGSAAAAAAKLPIDIAKSVNAKIDELQNAQKSAKDDLVNAYNDNKDKTGEPDPVLGKRKSPGDGRSFVGTVDTGGAMVTPFFT
jgi:hypothetical protein